MENKVISQGVKRTADFGFLPFSFLPEQAVFFNPLFFLKGRRDAMERIVKDDIIGAGIDKRVKGLLEPRIGVQAYTVTRSLLTGYIKTLLKWAKDNEFDIEH